MYYTLLLWHSGVQPRRSDSDALFPDFILGKPTDLRGFAQFLDAIADSCVAEVETSSWHRGLSKPPPITLMPPLQGYGQGGAGRL